MLRYAPVLLALAVFCSGCLYSNVSTPFDTDLDKTDLGTKVGSAESYGLLWLISWGDSGYAAAAKNGNIKTLKHADMEELIIFFGLYVRWRINVYGD